MEAEKLSSCPFCSSGWWNNSNDIQQINRRKENFNTSAQGIHRSMTIPKIVRQNEVCMSFWTKEGEVSKSQVDEKEQTFDKNFFAGPSRNNRTQRGI